MARLPDPLDTLTPEARAVYDKISAKRGAVRGPFASLMHHPALAERVGDLGEYLRFGGTLPGDVRELAILITARAVSQPYEWIAHAKVATREGLPADVIERVRTRGDLSALPAQWQAAVDLAALAQLDDVYQWGAAEAGAADTLPLPLPTPPGTPPGQAPVKPDAAPNPRWKPRWQAPRAARPRARPVPARVHLLHSRERPWRRIVGYCARPRGLVMHT